MLLADERDPVHRDRRRVLGLERVVVLFEIQAGRRRRSRDPGTVSAPPLMRRSASAISATAATASSTQRSRWESPE
jgi:hypothetical protein